MSPEINTCLSCRVKFCFSAVLGSLTVLLSSARSAYYSQKSVKDFFGLKNTDDFFWSMGDFFLIIADFSNFFLLLNSPKGFVICHCWFLSHCNLLRFRLSPSYEKEKIVLSLNTTETPSYNISWNGTKFSKSPAKISAYYRNVITIFCIRH